MLYMKKKQKRTYFLQLKEFKEFRPQLTLAWVAVLAATGLPKKKINPTQLR